MVDHTTKPLAHKSMQAQHQIFIFFREQAVVRILYRQHGTDTKEEFTMNDETTGNLDLGEFSDEALQALIPTIETEIARRRESRQKEALEKMREVAKSVGMTPEELLGIGGGRRRGGGKGKRGAIAWQHPDDPDKVYRGGKKPDWLMELKEQGRKPKKVENL